MPRTGASWPWSAVGLAPFVAVCMTAVASCAIALLAIPITFITTHDGYVALLAVSYGPYAAAQVLTSVGLAATLWSLVGIFGRGGTWRAVTTIGGGALAGVLGLWLAPLPFLRPLAAPWQYGPALPFSPGYIIAAAIAGGLAGMLPMVRLRPTEGTLTKRTVLWRACVDVASFALILALLLEMWVAVIAIFG